MKTVFGIVLSLSLSLATRAHAQAPGDAPVKLTIELTDPTRPIPPGGATLKPEVGLDQVLSIEALAGAIRAEQEQILSDLIAKTSDREVEEKGSYYSMLGELQAKQYRHWRLKSVELAQHADQAKTPKARAEATAAAEKAKQYLAKTVKTYRAFTENETYRSYPKLDTALFYYGYTLHSARQMTAAREVFYKLIKNHPTSKYVPEAYLVFGDYFFDAADLANAENSYKAVLKFPRSAVYWYAMYKLGWIHFNLQRFQEALETFFQVAQATRSNAPQEALNRASLKGFVVAYAGVGKPDKARPAFQRVDGKRAIEMLQLLGEIYLDQGKPDRAIALYQDLRAAEPAHPNACQWQYSIARATAYNATSPREIVICPGDVESFKAWARAGGVMVLGK